MHLILLAVSVMVLLAEPQLASALGVRSCGTGADTTLGVSAIAPVHFNTYRLGQQNVHVTARDIEILWDTLYTPTLTGDYQVTLENFIRTLAVTTGMSPTATDATSLQSLYNTVRREGSDWNPTNPADSTAYRVGRHANGFDDAIESYTNADRAHSDVYLFHPARTLTPSNIDGQWPSALRSDNEDLSTGHSSADTKALNSVCFRGPAAAQAIDLLGTGWTSPGSRYHLGTNHEIGHSFPPGDGAWSSELWSAGAEVITGIRDTVASDEFPYTWSLLAYTGSGGGNCANVRWSGSNYQGRTAFMAYVAYNFLNTNPSRTLSGSTDDLLTRWAKAGSTRSLSKLAQQLSDANCSTCAGKSYFRDGAVPMTASQRLNVLHHNWRVANFVNAPEFDEHQYGYPAWSGFSPATTLGMWQDFDGCGQDDIVALPAILTLSPRQLTRDTSIAGTRTFRGNSYPLALTAYGSNYWVIRAGPGLTAANRDLVVRIIPEKNYLCPFSFSLSLHASAVSYSTSDATGDESILWNTPQGVTGATRVVSTELDSAAVPIELVIPAFGQSNRSAVVVLTSGDGNTFLQNRVSDIEGIGYGEAVPYRLEVGFRSAPFMSVNPQPVSMSPALPEGEPTWAPAGDEVAYYSVDQTVSANPQVFRRKLDGTPPVAVAPQPALMQLAPDWSPRGDAIAFETAETITLSSRLWVAELLPTGSASLRQLTTLSGCASQPSFQPNGQGIAYTHIPDPNSPSPICYLRWVCLNGTGDTQLAVLGSPQNFRRRPRWSPNGQLIYVSMADQGDRVYAVPRFGGSVVPVGSIGPRAANFDLHPGSGSIAIEYPEFDNAAPSAPISTGCSGPPLTIHRIGLLDTTVAGATLAFRVSERRQSCRQPSYSPDGTRLIYQLQRQGNNDGNIEVRQVSWNHPPTFTPVMNDKGLSACVPFQFFLSGSDPDGEPLTYAVDYLPSGTQFIGGNTFRWQSPAAGEYFVVFRARDGSGGVDRRVVRFNVVNDGSCSDPLVEGDGGCGACLMGPRVPAGSSAVAAATESDAPKSNSYLNGALPGSWVTQTARLSDIEIDIEGRALASLKATLPGITALDRVRLEVVDHPANSLALATSGGIIVGRPVPIARVVDQSGRDLTAEFEAAAQTGQHLELACGTALVVTWGQAALLSGLAMECSLGGVAGWGADIGVDVQVPDGSEWRTMDCVRPRRGFDLLGTLTPGTLQARLVFLSDVSIRGISGFVTSADLDSTCRRHTLAATLSNNGPSTQALSETDGSLVRLAQGEQIAMAFPPEEPSFGLARSYFLELRASYTPPSGAWAARSGASKGSGVPERFALLQNRPNPFSSGTAFHFDVPRADRVRLHVFDPQGRRIRTVVDREVAPGSLTVEWDGRDERGCALKPGVYLYRLIATDFKAERRLVILP